MKRSHGFTLIELILTIVVVGIVALAVSNTLQLGFQSYNDSIDRQDNQMQAKFVIEKLSRELRHAVPNSVSITSSGQCVTFIPLETSAFYLSLPVYGETAIDTVILSKESIALDNLRLVINPSVQGDLLVEENHRYVSIDSLSVSGGVSTINFSSNNDPAFISSSISERAFLYKPNVVSYCIQSQSIFRSGVQIAEQLSSGSFIFEGASINRNSMITMTLIFENDLGELTQYQHDVQVLNVP
ncbi:putative exported protein MshO [Aliivibrio wodanis]|uniref:Putative exported protein MshO n=1 Tax=Aliivibrio wodanis TaxID=80852 RepID=A0A090IPD1_9GAMM|nr:putative exported protein MshO [Aliivibrio wodanis]VVV05109.1 hypothetical protein AW0309160_02529 [Aliivibrio wodanis]